MLADSPAGLTGDAHEDVDVGFGHFAPGEDAAHGHHHVFGFLFFEESDVPEHLFPHGDHALALFDGAFGMFFAGGLVVALDEEEFVADEKDGLGEVEGAVFGGGGDADDLGAEGEVFVVQAVFLGAEDDGDGGLGGAFKKAGSPGPGRGGMEAVNTFAVGGAGDLDAVVDGLGEGGDFLALGEDVIGADRHSARFLPVDGGLGLDKVKVAEAHVFHGPADGTDVSAVHGIDEDDANVVEGHGGEHGDLAEIIKPGTREGICMGMRLNMMYGGRMKVVFMGSSLFSLPALEALAGSDDVELVGGVTQPDRPQGRNRKVVPGVVRARAEELGIPVHAPEKIGSGDSVARLAEWGPELMVVASYGQYLPSRVLALPRLETINIHPSMLPKYRGAAPMQRALADGNGETGVTIFYIAKEMDAGDMIIQEPYPIDPEDNGVTLEAKLSTFGAELMMRAVGMIRAGLAPRTPQDHAAATYAPKIEKEEGRIDWGMPAWSIQHRVRGFQPWPGCFTLFRGRLLKVWKATVVEGAGRPGELLAGGGDGVVVATGNGALRLDDVQPEGKPRLDGAAFARGARLQAGERMGEEREGG